MTDSVNARREKVAYYLRNGMNEIKISQTLGVSRQTIVRDVSFMRNGSQNWIDGLARDGFIFEYKLGLDSMKENISKLEDLYNETKDTNLKLKLLREKREHIKIYLQLLSETPTVHALRKMEINNV